jgi:Protein of unknown function (DUF3987)
LINHQFVEWKDAPEHGDAADFFAAGGTVEQLEAMIQQDDSDAWDDPVPLPDVRVPVDAFDYELLPEPLRPWIQDIAERMSQPPDIPAMGAVATLGSLIGRKCGIYPKRHDDWLVIPNLWGLGVALPSKLKTPMMREVIKPLERLAAEAEADYAEALRQYEADRELYEAKAGGRKDAMRKAARDVALGKQEADSLETMAADRIAPPEPPTRRRYKTNDATVEKIGQLLIENPNGLLVYRDEMTGLLYSLEKTGREGDRQFYLESWDGKGDYDVDRIGRGELHIPALCLSLLGGIQPGPLAAYVAAASAEGQDNDGFVQRFQLTVWPDPPTTWCDVDRYPDTHAKNTAYAVYQKLAKLVPERYGARCENGETIPALRFDNAAQDAFKTWRDELENRLLAGDLHPAFEAHLAKYRSLMPSLALIFHLAECVTNEYTTARAVTLDSVRRAAAWCDYLESHARRLYDSAINSGVARASDLLKHIQCGEIANEEKVRDIWRHHWSGLSTPEETEAAIKTLADYGWVQVEVRKPPTGRSSKVLRIHPDLLATIKEEQAKEAA